jgi:hypothetical protein
MRAIAGATGAKLSQLAHRNLEIEAHLVGLGWAWSAGVHGQFGGVVRLTPRWLQGVVRGGPHRRESSVPWSRVLLLKWQVLAPAEVLQDPGVPCRGTLST